MEIRPLLAVDASAIQQSLLGDPAVAAWFRSSGPFTLAECDEFVTRKVAHRIAHGFGWSLAWEGDNCVGWSVAQYCIVDGATEVEIGWTVAPEGGSSNLSGGAFKPRLRATLEQPALNTRFGWPAHLVRVMTNTCEYVNLRLTDLVLAHARGARRMSDLIAIGYPDEEAAKRACIMATRSRRGCSTSRTWWG